MSRRLALFDFDGTLVSGDSLPRFVAACVGWPRTLLFAALGFLFSLGAKDRRTAFKAFWLKHCLRDCPLTKVQEAVAKLEKTLHWKGHIRDRLLWHKQRGDVVAVASGGLDVYLPHILRRFSIDHLLCTPMEIKESMLSGAMGGGNCVREEKARRVDDLIKTTGTYDEIWAYGNLPHDWPMLELATHRVIV